ncbi:craniofacial development protein 2 [Elysia marginata]|uniref:Craniofacial development protein 2 n=1 Tax=Elysia marginata TaxID=1093978 RepID=A0AAV4HGD6_9GAST|nr:craniofacial development protein 2 [Elysia marginata]
MTIDDFNQAMGDKAKETLGYRKTKKTEWITPGTWRAIEDRKQIKKKILDTKSTRLKERFCAQYKEKDIEVKRSACKDQRNYKETFAQVAQNAAELGDMKSVYAITKKLRRDRGINQEIPVKAEVGTNITDEKRKLERWKEHFEKILNRFEPTTFADIPEAEVVLKSTWVILQ